MFISTEQSERDSATAYRKSPQPTEPPTRDPGSPLPDPPTMFLPLWAQLPALGSGCETILKITYCSGETREVEGPGRGHIARP